MRGAWRYSLVILLILVGCDASPSTAPTSAVPTAPVPRPYLLHLPGVSGESFVDHTLIQGFRDAYLDADIEIYDWTEHDPGVAALQAIGRNKKQSQKIAQMLTAKFRADPRITIYLTCHSGGAGLAAWALEDLPPDVKVRRAVFIAPALSKGYDLSPALSRVRDKAYVLYSLGDVVILSAGTKMFGTIDGLYEDAAGYSGFTLPARDPSGQYAKLVQIPYDPAWGKYGHYGDHIGPMAARFSSEVIVPLIEGKAIARESGR